MFFYRIQIRRLTQFSMALQHYQIENQRSVQSAVDLLKKGSVIAVPTDTVYGIACDATNITSINKLYAIKRRHEEKPLAICLGDIVDVKKWARIEHLPNELLEALLPGPVTLILDCANKLDKSLSCKGKVGIRVPNYDFIRFVARNSHRPLALTSANISTEQSSVRVGEFEGLWDKLDGIFDGGDLSGSNNTRLASTIIDLSVNNLFRIVREGVAVEQTIKILKRFGLTQN